MASVLTFDELNKLGIERRSVPYREWFSVIRLPRERIEKRIDTAKAIEESLMGWFYFIMLMYDQAGYINSAQAAAVLEEALLAAIPENQRYPYVDDLIRRTAEDVTDATVRHWDDPYFLSEDRATVIAENQSHMVNSYDEYEQAVARGYGYKIWHGMLDNRERESHVEAEGQTVEIHEDFYVGEDSYFIVPAVPSELGADPEEYINCRCWATFTSVADGSDE